MTFEDWIGGRSAAEQDDILGKTVGRAFRAGKLTLKDTIGRDMAPLSLDELRRLDRLPADDA